MQLCFLRRCISRVQINIVDMKTLVRARKGSMQKLSKKRKLDACSLVVMSETRSLKRAGPSPCRRKGVLKDKKIVHWKKSNSSHHSNTTKKKSLNRFHGTRSLYSDPKDNKGDGPMLRIQNLKRQKRRGKKNDGVVIDEASKLERKARYLLLKMKLDQNLIDAYSGEGWKGLSREKIKPENELLRAKKQILKCKLGLRDTIHQLDSLGSVGKIDESLISADGSIHHKHIICKKCKSQEISKDNDILLCDGSCNCAFHQKCIDPPLATIDIPPEDEGWLCKYCDCKVKILEAINAHLGTQFSIDNTWQDVFKEEALVPNVENRDFNPSEEWPDDESDDDDYDPDVDVDDNNIFSRSSPMDRTLHEEASCSSLCSLESEVYSDTGLSINRNALSNSISLLHPDRVVDCDDHEIITGPRQRSSVDYKKLYDEMFGKENGDGEFVSEDEDWGPPRNRRKKEHDAANTLVTLFEGEVQHTNLHNLKVQNNHFQNSKEIQKTPLRIASDAVEKLREAFAENELPSRDEKKSISELIGLSYEKVDKWFKNARYTALKNRKANMELSDDMSLQNHLMQLKAKIKQKRKAKRNTQQRQVETVERHMDEICQLEARIRKLKQILSTILKPEASKLNDRCLNGYVMYVPVAELREKQ